MAFSIGSTLTTGGVFEYGFSMFAPRVVYLRSMIHTGFNVPVTCAVCPCTVSVQISFGLSEIFRHGDAEDIFVPPDGKMGGLPAVGRSGLEIVVRPDRNIRLFLIIAVHISEPHIEGAVRVGIVAFKHRRHALPGPMAKLDQLGA